MLNTESSHIFVISLYIAWYFPTYHIICSLCRGWLVGEFAFSPSMSGDRQVIGVVCLSVMASGNFRTSKMGWNDLKAGWGWTSYSKVRGRIGAAVWVLMCLGRKRLDGYLKPTFWKQSSLPTCETSSADSIIDQTDGEKERKKKGEFAWVHQAVYISTSATSPGLKGHCVVLELEFKLRIVIFTIWIKSDSDSNSNRTNSETSCSQRKIRSPEHCLELERCQGPPNINKVKQYEIVLPFKVSLFNQFIQPWKQGESVYLVYSSIKKNQPMKIFLFWLKCLPQNYTVHLYISSLYQHTSTNTHYLKVSKGGDGDWSTWKLQEATKVAGSAKYKQSKTVWNRVCPLRSVCLFSGELNEFIQFV